jgi:hypothetical protein
LDWWAGHHAELIVKFDDYDDLDWWASAGRGPDYLPTSYRVDYEARTVCFRIKLGGPEA